MRKAALAAGSVAMAIGLAGCGGGGTEGTPLYGDTQELVRAASQQTSQAKSSKFGIEMSMAGQQVTGTGAGRYTGENPAMTMSMQAMGQQVEMRLLDKTIYMKLPPNSPLASRTDKPWVKITPGSEGFMSQMLGSFDQMANQSDPTKILERVKQAGTITRSEQTELGGQQVSHYRIDLDFGKLVQQGMAMGMPKELLGQMQGQFAGVIIPAQLWLNSDQLPVQYSVDMAPMFQAMGEKMGRPGAMQGMGGTMTMKFSDWGAPVDVQAPPADQVGKMPEMPSMPGGKMPN